VRQVVGPEVTDAKVRALYDKDIAGKPGATEVHARHILLPTEEAADKVIQELDHGADFATLAKQHSTDPAASNGGDLGWFKKGDMVPAFADAAFALKPGQITEKPVHTQFGWHVIQVLGVRQEPAPTFDQAKNELRQRLVQKDVQKLIDEAKQGVPVEKFGPDGMPMPTGGGAASPAPNMSAPAGK